MVDVRWTGFWILTPLDFSLLYVVSSQVPLDKRYVFFMALTKALSGIACKVLLCSLVLLAL